VINCDGVRPAGSEIGGAPRLPRTAEGGELYRAGEAFYRVPCHAPIALEGSEYVGFSPTSELAPVLAHLTGVR
jgi:hypothetical protein